MPIKHISFRTAYGSANMAPEPFFLPDSSIIGFGNILAMVLALNRIKFLESLETE
jgi:hypothetical protein